MSNHGCTNSGKPATTANPLRYREEIFLRWPLTIMYFDESYIYRKEVNWSLLHDGLTIPLRLLFRFRNLLNGYERGISRKVILLVDGQPFEAALINQAFDRGKYSRHADVVQIRFTSKSGLPQKLRQIFSASYAYLKKERELVRGRKVFVRLPEDSRESFIHLYNRTPGCLFSGGDHKV